MLLPVYDANIVGIRAGSPEVWLFFVREKRIKPPVVRGQQIKCKLEKDNAGNVDCPNCDARLKLDANEVAAAKFTCPNDLRVYAARSRRINSC
jgi:hypothetical protein